MRFGIGCYQVNISQDDNINQDDVVKTKAWILEFFFLLSLNSNKLASHNKKANFTAGFTCDSTDMVYYSLLP